MELIIPQIVQLADEFISYRYDWQEWYQHFLLLFMNSNTITCLNYKLPAKIKYIFNDIKLWCAIIGHGKTNTYTKFVLPHQYQTLICYCGKCIHLHQVKWNS